MLHKLWNQFICIKVENETIKYRPNELLSNFPWIILLWVGKKLYLSIKKIMENSSPKKYSVQFVHLGGFLSNSQVKFNLCINERGIIEHYK